MVLNSDSVGSEEGFRMLNVPAVPAVSQQEQQFLLEQPRHLSSSGITGQDARRAIFRMFPDQQQKVKVIKAVRTLQDTNEEDLNNTGVLQSVREWTDKTDDNANIWEAATRHFNKVSVSSCFLLEIDRGCLQPSVFDDSIFGENQCQSKSLSGVRKKSMVGFVM